MNVDRSAWGRLRVTGGDRVRFLQGLTTVNVEQLADGAHAWGAILNPKGRVLHGSCPESVIRSRIGPSRGVTRISGMKCAGGSDNGFSGRAARQRVRL